MNIYDYQHRQLPDYYTAMYMDGYKPYEIMEAHRNTMRKEMEQTAPQTVSIVSTIKMK